MGVFPPPQFYVLTFLIIFGVTTATLSPKSKIDSSLVQMFQREPSSKLNIFVEMKEGNANILRRVDSLRFSSRTEKINTMKTQLESLAEASQKGILSILEEEEADFISFWINNRVFVRDATLELVEKLAMDEQVKLIRQEEIFHGHHHASTTTSNSTIKAIWNLEKIEAPKVWGMPFGNRGEGVVVAVIDSGVSRTHESLRDNFREEYGWYDPYNLTPSPSDVRGGGTSVAGIIVGSHGPGVAPGAKWIACKGEGDHWSESGLTSCGQWIVCPTRPNGEDADCSKAPHISANSWGGTDGLGYGDVINAWHSARIIPIFSIGGGISDCGNTASPGDFENVIGVGSTDETDTFSLPSSRGPSPSGLIKPDICAPGSDVMTASSSCDYCYAYAFGAGFASPHVAGAAALLLSRNSSLSFEQVKELLQNNTERNLGPAEECGNIPPTQFPNNVYGYGRLNARKAFEALLKEQYSSAPSPRLEFTIENIEIIIYFTFLVYGLLF